ncbi:MAG: phosphatidylglycerophosphatase A [Alphaproteobacteria bacterium]|nr:phosphatidylglycerophosphatase A [Alphaproteobacteria bacterium]
MMLLATWFGCGRAKRAPGTWGTLGSLPFGILFMVLGGWPLLLVATVLVSIIGYYAAAVYERETGTHDSGAIVIDEVAGMWLTLCAATLTPLSIVLAFALFRGFDILKPWPVSWADRKLPGAAGVMADDILAGVYAALCLWGLCFAGLG